MAKFILPQYHSVVHEATGEVLQYSIHAIDEKISGDFARATAPIAPKRYKPAKVSVEKPIFKNKPSKCSEAIRSKLKEVIAHDFSAVKDVDKTVAQSSSGNILTEVTTNTSVVSADNKPASPSSDICNNMGDTEVLSEDDNMSRVESSDNDSDYSFPNRRKVAKFLKVQKPLDISVQNKFSPLSVDKDLPVPSVNHGASTSVQDTPQPTVISAKKPQISPIYVEKVGNGLDLLKSLQLVCSGKVTGKNSKDFFVVKVENSNDHKLVLDCLKELRKKGGSASFFTHRVTEERRHKVVLRGLSSNVDPISIKEELKQHGFEIFHVSEMLKKDNDGKFSHLGLYICEINHAQLLDFKNQVKYVCSHRITVEELKNNTRIPHCDNCQMWGHTKNYCGRETRCPLCAGHHSLEKCNPRPATPHCVNCNLDHVATYAGCPALLSIKREREAALERLKNKHSPPKSNAFSGFLNAAFPSLSQSKVSSNVSYANAVTGNSQPTSSTFNFADILNKIIAFFSKFDFSKIIQGAIDLVKIFISSETASIKLMKASSILLSIFSNA